GDRLHLRVERHRLLAVGAEIAELRAARAGEAEVGNRHRNRHVDADLADVHLALEFARRRARLREDARAVAVRIGVDDADRFIERFRLDEAEHRAEDLGLVDLVPGLHAGEDRGTDEVALVVAGDIRTAPVELELRTFPYARIDEPFDARLRLLRNQRPQVRAGLGARRALARAPLRTDT